MEANELRIGNILLFQESKGELFGINKDCIVQYSQENDVFNCGIDEIQPIELTKEMFNIENDVEINFNNVIFEFWHDKLYFTAGEGCQLSEEIKYLHELQNFVFLFSKKELDINKIKL